MKRLESNIEGRVTQWAEHNGILHSKLNPMGRRGWPDRVFWLAPGNPLLIEFKRVDCKPEKLQRYIMKMLKGKGYDVRWTDSAAQAIGWLKDRLKKAKAAKTP